MVGVERRQVCTGCPRMDLELQARARGFVDSLIPYEVEAEMNGGNLPDDVDAGLGPRHASSA